MRTPTAILAGVVDNAMLYKDITQWLRNRTFLLLFFGLLAIAEITTALVVLMPSTEENLGAVIFGILSGVLFVYALIIAFLGHNLTAREFFNRTFELYELSGMSLERMVWGKVLSMLAQFFFGFFCLVPFMFVSFMLGGLDFYLVIAVCAVIVLAIVPIYLLALFVALLSRSKQISGLVRGIILVVLFLFLPWWGIMTFVELMMMRSGFASPVDFLKLLLLLDAGAVRSALIFLAFYAQICLLLYYACCNAISPSTDSRVTAIHCTSFLLSVSYLVWILSWVWGGRISESVGYVFYIPVMILYLFIGLGSFYGPLDVPVMTVRRRRAARFWGTRLIYFLFHPGAVGGCKTLALFYGLFLLFWGLVAFSGFRPPAEFHDAASVAFQTPFFLIVPGALLIRSRHLARNPVTVRMAIVMWWVLLGIPLMITASILRDEWQSFGTTSSLLLHMLALLVSPLSSLFLQGEVFSPFRVALGVLGFMALPAVIGYRKLRESAPAPGVSPR
jgi:hypothetical protein